MEKKINTITIKSKSFLEKGMKPIKIVRLLNLPKQKKNIGKTKINISKPEEK